MFSKHLSLATVIVLSSALSACATQSSGGMQHMMNKASAMDCKQMAEDARHEQEARAPEGRRGGREEKKMKKAGCPMMAAKMGEPKKPSDRDQSPSGKDSHDHQP